MNLNSPPPSQISNDIIMNNDQPNYHPFAPINNHYPNSSSLSCHFFFNSTQDHNMGYYHDHPQLYLPDDNHHHHGYNNNQCHEMENKIDQSGLKLSLWDSEDGEKNTIVQHNNNSNPVKWMSSKMRLMHKMKTQPGRVTLKITTGSSKIKDQTSSLETTTDNFSSYNNSPIRACSDCNTTKTPLWRSGPKGPKSLCNACGIRQRKARRAMAAAAASGTAVAANTASLRMKAAKNGPIKKRCKAAGPTSEEGSASTAEEEEEKKNSGLEDFLINLSKNLSCHRVFPEDEKDAAILLMALSSGLVHG